MQPRDLKDVVHPGPVPKITVLSGSTRFHREMHAAALQETLKGHIVLVVGSDDKSDEELGVTAEQKEHLEALHRHKIDLADEMLVINVGGYVGESTRKEIDYARSLGMVVWFLHQQ